MSFLLFYIEDLYCTYAQFFMTVMNSASYNYFYIFRHMFTYCLVAVLHLCLYAVVVVWNDVTNWLCGIGSFISVCTGDHLLVLETQAQAALEAAHILILVSQHDEVFHSYIKCVCSTSGNDVFSSNINSSPFNVRVLRLGRSGWFVDDVVQDPQQIHTQAQLILAQRQAPTKVAPAEDLMPALLSLPLPEPMPILVPLPVPQKQETKYPYLSLWRSIRLIAAICVGYYAIVAVV